MWTYLYFVVSVVATDNFLPIIIITKGYFGLKIIYTLFLIGHRFTLDNGHEGALCYYHQAYTGFAYDKFAIVQRSVNFTMTTI